jgi:gluconolactonase
MRTKSFLPAVVAAAGLHALAVAGLQPGSIAKHPPRIVRLDPRFDRLVPKEAVIEKVADGFSWVEGPVWNRKQGYLLFSDIPKNAVMKWQEGRGASVFLKSAGYSGQAPFAGPEPGSNGLAYDPEGRLVLCEHGNRRISRLEPDGRKTTLVDRYQGRRINSPNDVVFKSNGDLYFTDPPFGLPKGADDPGRELPFCGVYRVAKDGSVTLLTKEVRFPNGIAFSPSEKTLYVSNADRDNAVWMAFEVEDDGTIANSRVVFDATAWTRTKKGVPDGMKVDSEGNLFAAGPEGIHVFTPDGAHLGSFDFGVPTGNCNWGGDGSVLYITSNTGIYRIQTATRGATFQAP